MDITRLEKIFQDIWEHDSSQKKKFRPYETPFQKYTFWLMGISFLVIIGVALHAKTGIEGWHKPTALILLIVCQISALAYEFSFVILGSKILSEPTKHFLEPITKTAAIDYSLADTLCRFEDQQLGYAKKRLDLEISQMKTRVSLLVGALEKVGIIPVFIAWAFALFKYVDKKTLTFSEIDYIAYGLMGLYILAVSIVFFIHKLERYSLLIETSINLKANKQVNKDAGASAPSPVT